MKEKDLLEAMKIIEEYKSPIEMAIDEFYLGKYKIKWLEDFTSKTIYCYKDWHSVCVKLLDRNIVPTIKVLNDLSWLAGSFNKNPNDCMVD